MSPNFTPPQPHILPFRAFYAAHFEKGARDRWLQTIFNPAAPHFEPLPFNTIPGASPWPSAYNMPTPLPPLPFAPFGRNAYHSPPPLAPPQDWRSYTDPGSRIYVSGLPSMNDEERYERQGIYEEQLHAYGVNNQGYVQPLHGEQQGEGEYEDEESEYEEYEDEEGGYEDEGGEYEGDDNDDDDEHVHFELTEEAIAMFAFSEARRQERLAQRALEAESAEDASTSVANAEPLATALLRYHPPSAASNAVIEAMESTLDAYYERSCADEQVVLWPVLPLRL